MKKVIQEPRYSCRFHPYDGWHEVGCHHQNWSKLELQKALDNSKLEIDNLVNMLKKTIKDLCLEQYDKTKNNIYRQ